MKKLIISLSLMLIAIPSFANWDSDRAEIERAIATKNGALVAVKQVYKGQFICQNCSTANDYNDYMWAGLQKLPLVEGNFVHIYNPRGNIVIVVRLGRVMVQNSSVGATVSGVVFSGHVTSGVIDRGQLALRREGSAVVGTNEKPYLITTLKLEKEKARFDVVTKYNATISRELERENRGYGFSYFNFWNSFNRYVRIDRLYW